MSSNSLKADKAEAYVKMYGGPPCENDARCYSCGRPEFLLPITRLKCELYAVIIRPERIGYYVCADCRPRYEIIAGYYLNSISGSEGADEGFWTQNN